MIHQLKKSGNLKRTPKPSKHVKNITPKHVKHWLTLASQNPQFSTFKGLIMSEFIAGIVTYTIFAAIATAVFFVATGGF